MEFHYWYLRKNFWCSLSGSSKICSKKFLQNASDILKHWVLSGIKSKLTSRSLGIHSFKKTVLRLNSWFGYLYPYHLFTTSLPLSISHFSKFLQRCWNLSLSKKILLYLTAWLEVIPFLQWYEWRDVEWRHWRVLVGLICKSASSCLFVSVTLASKNFISSFDQLAVSLVIIHIHQPYIWLQFNFF